MAVKAKDIARELGISPATLSLVVNNRPGISDTTRERVLKQLRDRNYDYLISSEQRAQSEGYASGTIGFVTFRRGGELLGYNSFFPLIIEGMENRARKNGFNLAYINIDSENAKEEVRYISDAKCCGIVIFATEMYSEDLEFFDQIHLPIVILDNDFFLKDSYSVSIDNRQSTFLAMKYLKTLGHRRVGYLRSALKINSFDERFQETVAAARQLEMEDVSAYTWEIGYPIEKAQEGMERMLQTEAALPTAFMADNDLVAAGAMRAAIESGLKVPEELSFVGFDDRPVCTICDPALTTIQISRENFGAEAVGLLIRILKKEVSAVSLHIKLAGQLIERGSTGRSE